MGKTITPQRFKELKAATRGNATLALAARREGVSMSTIRRVNTAKNYLEFKALLVKDRGPKYAERRAKSNTTSTQKKPGLVNKVLAFFDIRVQH